MLNPMIAWEPGTLVRYSGSLASLHGIYAAHPCTCLNCNDPVCGAVRFRLDDSSGSTVATCVRARSITPDHLAAAVTAGGGHLIVFADGHRISIFGRPGVEEFDEVFCHPGLDVDWDHTEDRWEPLQSGDPKLAEGRLFQEVPVADVRALIDAHGGIEDQP